MVDLFREHLNLGVVELLVGRAHEQFDDEDLRAVVLGFVEQTLFDLPLAGRTKDFLLNRRMDAEFGANLLDQHLFLGRALGSFELGEQVLDFTMVGL